MPARIFKRKRPGTGVSVRMTGYEETLRRARSIQAAIPPAIAGALHREAKRMMSASQDLVPIVSGQLHGSAYVTSPRIDGPVISVELGYNARHAIVTHENPRAGKTGGVSPKGKYYPEGTYSRTGQWKFLDTPVYQMAGTMKQRIGADVYTQLRSMFGPFPVR